MSLLHLFFFSALHFLQEKYLQEYISYLLDFPISQRCGCHGGTWATGNYPSHIRVPYLFKGSAKEKEIHEE